jgi:LuxR family maltose regulon positive regulatory protein
MNRIQTADSSDREAVYTDVMAALLNEIAELPEPFSLVLDDCHLLKNPFLLRLLTFLIERQPPQLRLFLLTREDLPLPISRLRVRRQVVEIRQSDLQFTLQEAEDFLYTGMGISRLPDSDIQALEQRTEGWIAGLQLAALSLKNSPDPSGFICCFTGSDRYILDYLLEEVFTTQPQELRDFLLCTSILDRFCAPVCDALLNEYKEQAALPEGRARALLDVVERSNLFLIPLDNQRQWFRYHHLFGDLLKHELSQLEPKKVSGLHRFASQWFEANGFIREAVKHAFLSQNWPYTAELVERHAMNFLLHSQVATLSGWCNQFPEAVIRKRPALCVFHAWALIIAFKNEDFPAANLRLEQAQAALADINPESSVILQAGDPPVNMKQWVAGQITLLNSFILMAAPRRQADPQALIDLGRLAYEQIPPADIATRSAALLDIGYANQASSDAPGAEASFEHAVRVASSGGNYFGSVVAEYHRAHDRIAQGRLRAAIEFCLQKKKAYSSYFKDPIHDLPAIALLDQAMGCALLEMNELAAAETLLREGLAVGQWMPREELPGYLGLARLCAAKGDAAGTAEALRRLDLRWPDIRYCTAALRQLYALKAQPEDAETRKAAAQWAAEHAPDVGPAIVLPGIGPAWNDEADYAVYTAWAQIQILLGRTQEALAVIQPLLDSAQEHGLNHRVIDLALLQAQVFYVQGLRDRVWKPLRTALSLAEDEGYLRLADQGPVLVRLLREAAQLGMARAYIQRNLDSLQPDASPLPAPEPADAARPAAPAQFFNAVDGLLEPLSSREIEVLALMAEGLSTNEIAARLYLSPLTLKSHSHNIYSKLDVHNRVQAVNKARDLKII